MNVAEIALRAKEDIDAVHEAGQKAEYDRFWDVYQQNGNRTNYDNAFAGNGWTIETCKPKHNIKVYSGYMMFRYCALEVDMVEWLNELGITFNDSGNGNCNYMYFNSRFTRIGTTTIKNQAGDLFAYCPNLHTIDKIVCTQNTTFSNTTFTNSPNLANVIFEGVIASNIGFAACPKLTHDSLVSIINALKDLVTYKEVVTEYPNASFSCVPADGSMWSLNKWYKIEGWYDENFGCGFVLIGEDGLGWHFGLSRELYDELKNKNAEYWRGYSVANDVEGYGFAIKSTEKTVAVTKTLTIAKNLTNITAEQVTTEIAKAIEKGWTVVQ